MAYWLYQTKEGEYNLKTDKTSWTLQKLIKSTDWWFKGNPFITSSLPIKEYLCAGPVLISFKLVKIFKSSNSRHGRYFMITYHVFTINKLLSKFIFGLDIHVITVQQKFFFFCEMQYYGMMKVLWAQISESVYTLTDKQQPTSYLYQLEQVSLFCGKRLLLLSI